MALPALAIAGLVGKGIGAIGNAIGKSKDRKLAAKNAAAQAAYDQATRQQQIKFANDTADKNENSRINRFRMGIGILRSLGDTFVPGNLIDSLEARGAAFAPVHAGDAVAEPVAKQPGFNFFSTLGSLGNLAGDYAFQKEAADNYENEFNSQSSPASAVNPYFGGGQKPFGGSVDFSRGRTMPSWQDPKKSRTMFKPHDLPDINDLFSAPR